MTKKILAAVAVVLVTVAAAAQNTAPDARPRASDLGLKVGVLPTGPPEFAKGKLDVVGSPASMDRNANIAKLARIIESNPGCSTNQIVEKSQLRKATVVGGRLRNRSSMQRKLDAS